MVTALIFTALLILFIVWSNYTEWYKKNEENIRSKKRGKLLKTNRNP